MFQRIIKNVALLAVIAVLCGAGIFTVSMAKAEAEMAVDSTTAPAKPEASVNSGLTLPRYVSLASNQVNLRVGPGLKYPISWVLTRESLPVEIVREFDTWREIRTTDGDQGWVHQSLLSGRRTAMVHRTLRRIYQNPSADSRPLAEIEPGVIVGVETCAADWCEIEILNYNGWIEKEGLWGVYPYEKFD